MAKEKLYLVKREVMAKNIREAITRPGVIYCIELVGPKPQPEERTAGLVGFDKRGPNKPSAR